MYRVTPRYFSLPFSFFRKKGEEVGVNFFEVGVMCFAQGVIFYELGVNSLCSWELKLCMGVNSLCSWELKLRLGVNSLRSWELKLRLGVIRFAHGRRKWKGFFEGSE